MRCSKVDFCLLLLCSAIAAHAQIQCPNGIVVYEKSSAITVNPDSRPDRTIEVSSTEVPTSACQRVCDGTPSCTAYTVEYGSRTCQVYSGTIQKSRLLLNHESAFFEKLCLPDIPETRFRSMCAGRLWAVERVRGATFNGPVARLEQNVPNRAICTRICLSETNFNCASAVYDEVSRSCALSSESRRTEPTAFTSNDSRSAEYMENHCISDLRDCQYLPQKGSRVVALDYITVAKSEEQCRNDCNRNTAIICRAYSYELARNSCHLTSDDSISLQGVDLPTEEGLRYAERRCRHAPGVVILPEPSPYQQVGGPQALPLTSNFNPSQSSYIGNTAFPPNYGGGIGANTNYGQGIPSQIPQNQFPQYSGFTPSTAQIPYGVPGNTGYNVNQGYTPAAFGQRGSFSPFPINPNSQFSGNRGYPSYGPEVTSPRIFNMFRNPYNNGNEFGSFITPERCTFEKSTGLAVISDPQGAIPVTNYGRGITPQCSTWCRFQGPNRCPAFILDYTSNQCNVLSRPADVTLAPGTVQGQSYFEQICFSTPYPACEGKSFAFERFVHFELRGFDDRVLSSVGNIRDCEEACLKEIQFQCVSAEYDRSKLECRLSRENKLSRSYAFQQSPNVDYLENQCVPTITLSTCSPERQDGQALLYVDAILGQVYTEDECRRSCQTFPNFTCIAASYRQTENECSLSNGVTTVARTDSILLYTSCSQPNLVQPTFNNNFGQSLVPNGQQLPMGFQQPLNPNQPSGYIPYNPGYNPLNQAFPPQYPQFYNSIPGTITVGQGQSFPNQYPVMTSTIIPSSGQFGQQYPISSQSGQQYPISNQFGQQYPISSQFGQQFPTSVQFGQQFPAPNQFGQQYPVSVQTSENGQTSTGQLQPGFQEHGRFVYQLPTGQYGQQFLAPGQFEQQFPDSTQFGQRFPVFGQPDQQRPASVQFSRTGQGSRSDQFPNSEGFSFESNFPSVYHHSSQFSFPGPPTVNDSPVEVGQPPEVLPVRQNPSSRRQNSNRSSRRRNKENVPERVSEAERLNP